MKRACPYTQEEKEVVEALLMFKNPRVEIASSVDSLVDEKIERALYDARQADYKEPDRRYKSYQDLPSVSVMYKSIAYMSNVGTGPIVKQKKLYYRNQTEFFKVTKSGLRWFVRVNVGPAGVTFVSGLKAKDGTITHETSGVSARDVLITVAKATKDFSENTLTGFNAGTVFPCFAPKRAYQLVLAEIFESQ